MSATKVYIPCGCDEEKSAAAIELLSKFGAEANVTAVPPRGWALSPVDEGRLSEPGVTVSGEVEEDNLVWLRAAVSDHNSGRGPQAIIRLHV